MENWAVCIGMKKVERSSPSGETGAECESPGGSLGLLPCPASGDHSLEYGWVQPQKALSRLSHVLVVTGGGFQVES